MSRVTGAVVSVCLLVVGDFILAAQNGSESGSKTAQATSQTAASYFPERFEWQHKKPEEAGMDSARLEEAVKYAIANENPAPKDLALDMATTFGAKEPFDTPIGPVKARGAANGLVT